MLVMLEAWEWSMSGGKLWTKKFLEMMFRDHNIAANKPISKRIASCDQACSNDQSIFISRVMGVNTIF